jgi:hypothetical protein|tara:strand:- start:509 stop:682 length:174 start_codon:yes stop_codon:yes gene_type:complete
MLAPKCHYFVSDTRSVKRINKINKKYGIITLLNSFVSSSGTNKAKQQAKLTKRCKAK